MLMLTALFVSTYVFWLTILWKNWRACKPTPVSSCFSNCIRFLTNGAFLVWALKLWNIGLETVFPLSKALQCSQCGLRRVPRRVNLKHKQDHFIREMVKIKRLTVLPSKREASRVKKEVCRWETPWISMLHIRKQDIRLGMTPLGGTRTSESWHLEPSPRHLCGVYVMPGSSKNTTRAAVMSHAWFTQSKEGLNKAFNYKIWFSKFFLKSHLF